jgi:ABC-type multidrug transport system permease subunit
MKEMKDVKPTDYRGFFIIGISLIAVGISLMSEFVPAFLGFLGCGVVFMAIGLTNKDKWAKSKKET